MSEQEKKVQQKPRAPWVRLASGYYQADLGEHPDFAPEEMFTFPPELSELAEEHLEEYDLPIIPCMDGHNVMTTNSTPSIIGTDVKVPLSPNFVKDISGRIIYTGYGPETKNASHWKNNRHVTFPEGCRVVTRKIEGSEYIGNIFFTRFRSLDVSMSYEHENALRLFSYKGENLYPYKLRLDTFYQDGWRLPQTNMLYARKNVEQAHARRIGEKFLEEWEKAKAYADTREFIHQNGGDAWIEKLFQAGCTVIPTYEAKNAYNIVNNDFTVEKKRAGRAIEGLHEIIEVKASAEPKNTIIDVLEPGYVTATHIHPAKVIVSDGTRYEMERKAFPLREFIDHRLPHQRTQAIWGNCWVPTHPTHFDEPAIWGWDLNTGKFLQLTGPAWDPLHYYYESTPLVIKAFKNHIKGSNHLAVVPSEMKERFYPATNINGFDVISYGVRKMRDEKGIRPASAVLRVTDHVASSNIGYHPLPLAYEYELAPFWSPELMPTARATQMPENIIVSPIITPAVSVRNYQDNASDYNESQRLKMDNIVKEPSTYALENYPDFKRYFSEVPEDEIKELATIVLDIPEKAPEKLSETFPAYQDMDTLSEGSGMPIYRAVKEFKLRSLRNLKTISDAYYSEDEPYALKYWKGR